MLADEGYDDDVVETSRMLGAHQCLTELRIPAATVRSWANRGQLYARALDGQGRPLYFEHEIVALRNTRRVAVAKRAATMQHRASSTRVSTDRVLSCVRGRGGVMAGNDQTPTEEPLVPTEIVVPVSLDLSKAESQLSAFCDRVVRDIGQAVATGLSVHSMTVVLAPPPVTD
jgi:hypothetical protein